MKLKNVQVDTMEFINEMKLCFQARSENESFARTVAAAFVAPMTGREYEESQKIRAETTYKISTRYFQNISHDMRILYNKKEFEIVSVLDLNERHEELQIVVAEKGRIIHKSGDSDGE